MRRQPPRSLGVVAATAAVTAVTTVLVMSSVTPTPTTQDMRPSTVDGKPNFSGLWQALNEAHWDLEAHEARPGAVTQPGVYPYDYARVPAAPVLALGAAGGVPGSVGVVTGDGQIPYRPEAAARKAINADEWIDRDPELKCFLPGIPRAMYMPYPFEIVQGPSKILMAFAFAGAARTIHLDDVSPPPAEVTMGHSVGHWEGETLVVESTHFANNTWLDRAGNYHSDALRLVERLTPLSADAMHYEASVDDPNVFTRPWTIAMPLYRRLEPNAQLLEYNCVEFVEEFVYGHLRKEPLVTRWEGKTLIVDITRKVPPPDELYAPIGQ